MCNDCGADDFLFQNIWVKYKGVRSLINNPDTLIISALYRQRLLQNNTTWTVYHQCPETEASFVSHTHSHTHTCTEREREIFVITFETDLNLNLVPFSLWQVCSDGLLLGPGPRGEAQVSAACSVSHRISCSAGCLRVKTSFSSSSVFL